MTYEIDDRFIKSGDKSGSEFASELVSDTSARQDFYKSTLNKGNESLELLSDNLNLLLDEQKTTSGSIGKSSKVGNKGVVNSGLGNSEALGTGELANGAGVINVSGHRLSKQAKALQTNTETAVTSKSIVSSHGVKSIAVNAGIESIKPNDNGIGDDMVGSLQGAKNIKDIRKAYKSRKETKAGKQSSVSVKQRFSDYKQSFTNKTKAVAEKAKKILATIGKMFAQLGGAIVGALGGILLPIIAGFLVIILIFFLLAGGAGASQNKGYGNLEGTCLNLCIFLREKGVDDVQIAAICGNVWGESGYRTNAIEYDNNGNELYGHGICQWSFGRWTQLQNYANSKGKDWTDETVQFEFLWAELTGEGDAAALTNRQISWTAFCGINNVDDATTYFCRQFERPANPVQPRRQEEARRVYEQLTSGSNYDGDNEIVARAYECIGKPYVWGGCGDSGYDCSGLVSYAVTGVKQHAYTTYVIMTWTQVSDPKAGDILVTAGHCGVYIGDGKMIHASEPGVRVSITNVDWFLAQGAKFVRYGG